jgi:type 1 glutamine amidotransferase
MPIILHRAQLNCLISVRGHPFDRTAFDAIFQDMAGINAVMVDQPAAARLMTPDGMRGFDVLVLYDMPGLDFQSGVGAPAYLSPDRALQSGFRALLEQGTGVVALHHALAGWPDWPAYGEWLGGRFLYHSGTVRGVNWPDSGYAHNMEYFVEKVADHPVTEGIPGRFAIKDELYLCPVFENSVTPLLCASIQFTSDHFRSAELALRGRLHDRGGWTHPKGSNVIGWAKTAINSRLVYLQPGDGPSAYNNSYYRRLLRNAIEWAAAR